MGRHKTDMTVRLNLRLSPTVHDRMMQLAEGVGIKAPTGAARHFLTLGMQVSLSALSASHQIDFMANLTKVMQRQGAAAGGPAVAGLDAAPESVKTSGKTSGKRA